MRNAFFIVAGALCCAVGVGCSQEATGGPSSQPAASAAAQTAREPAPLVDPSAEINPRLLRRFKPLPTSFEPEANVPASEINLGRMLFYDGRLSKSGQISCNSCHDLDSFGVDHARASTGHGGKVGKRNAPTVYNAAGEFAQFWDGRASDVEEQAKGPILNPSEMAMTDSAAVVGALKAIPGYVTAFKDAFPADADPVTFDNVGRAVGAFERGLVTPSRWDKYLEGDKSQLTPAEKEGLKTFVNIGCMVCHTGTLLGGSMFERAGAVEPWPNRADTGRMEVTHAAADSMMFKVPSLRNIAKTAPYFHDGSAATLEDAVRTMGRHQLGLDLSDAEIGSIVTWLDSLTGQLPAAYVAKPELPK